MEIAIATDDRKSIAKRTGRAAEFAIYSIENGEIQSIDYKKNKHTHHHESGKGEHNHQHDHGEHKHDEIIDQLQGVDMFLLRAVGKYLKNDLKKGNIPFQLVKVDNIKEIISNYLKTLPN